MKLHFEYNREKDIWCLLNKGKSSNNSQLPTKVYQELTAQQGESPTEEKVSEFIETYISENRIDVKQYRTDYEKDWDVIADEYKRRAEAIFGTSLPADITAYLTINNRCPYDIAGNYFFVSVPSHSARRIVMHELWHFYTWYGFGTDQEEKMGKQKYNDMKEALTVLLNAECRDLLPIGEYDEGYPQHRDMREKILRFWEKEKNILKLWEHLAS